MDKNRSKLVESFFQWEALFAVCIGLLSFGLIYYSLLGILNGFNTGI